jgi:hypothetical protein
LSRYSLVEVRTTNRGPRAFFTEAGLAALRLLVLDRRAMDPERFGHLRAELGLEAWGAVLSDGTPRHAHRDRYAHPS